MAASARVKSAAANTAAPSKSRSSDVFFASIPATPVDLAASTFAYGTRATAPVTYGDLANPSQLRLDQVSNMALDFILGTISGMVHADFSPNTLGQRVWFCYIQGTSPAISGTVLDAAYDLGLLVA